LIVIVNNMPIPQPYFLDSASLSNATAVFLDNALTTCAPDGFYSDGIIVRRQYNCQLYPAELCSSCSPTCDTIANVSTSSEPTGSYRVQLDVGSSLGIIVIRFNPSSFPDGIRSTYGVLTYNKVSSLTTGPIQSNNYGNYIMVGDIADIACIPSGQNSYGVYLYNGTTFDSTGLFESYEILAGDIYLSSPPGNVTMVVPKTSTTENTLIVEILSPCTNATWDLTIECPSLLTGNLRSPTASSFVEACSFDLTETYYFVSVAPVPSAINVGLYDYVFSNSNGSVALPNGFYKVGNGVGFDVIEVLNGNVVDILTCGF